MTEDFLEVGQQLQAAREREGLSVRQVAEQIRVSVSYIAALEAADLSQLPERTFVIGYVRAYGRILGMDTDSLVIKLQAKLVDSSKEAGLALPSALDGHNKGAYILGFIAAGLCVLIGLGVLVSSFSGVEEVAGVESSQSALPFDPDAVAVDEQELPTELQVKTDESEDVALPADGQVRATVQLLNDSWVEVSDGADEVVYANLARAGVEMDLQGVPPLQFTFGKASAVKVIYQGKAIDLEPGSKGIARLTLP